MRQSWKLAAVAACSFTLAFTLAPAARSVIADTPGSISERIPLVAFTGCQAEYDNLVAASAAVVVAAQNYDLAQIDVDVTEEALAECETNTPGNCADEEDDYNLAFAALELADDALNAAIEDYDQAQDEYDECVENQ